MRFSKFISIILHPIFMPTIAIYLSLKLIPNIGFAITNYLSFIYPILILSTIILPLMSVYFLKKKKIISSLEMRNHKERSLPIFITIMWMIYGYYKLAEIFVLSPILKSECIGAIIILLTASIISIFWKISLHMLGIGGLVGVLFGLNILFGGIYQIAILSVVISGFLASARITEKAHNEAQIYTGFLIGFLIEFGSVLFL